MPKPAVIPRVSRGIIWNCLVKLLDLGLLVLLSVSLAGLCFLARQLPSRNQSASSCVRWYFSSGQWRADVRTLVAMFEYINGRSPNTPAATGAPTNQLASPSLLQVKWSDIPSLLCPCRLSITIRKARRSLRSLTAIHQPQTTKSRGIGKRLLERANSGNTSSPRRCSFWPARTPTESLKACFPSSLRQPRGVTGRVQCRVRKRSRAGVCQCLAGASVVDQQPGVQHRRSAAAASILPIPPPVAAR